MKDIKLNPIEEKKIFYGNIVLKKKQIQGEQKLKIKIMLLIMDLEIVVILFNFLVFLKII